MTLVICSVTLWGDRELYRGPHPDTLIPSSFSCVCFVFLFFFFTMQPETFHSAKLNLTETPAFTDLSRWRLRVEEGAQTWHYLETDEECREWPQTFWDKYHLGLPTVIYLANLFECVYTCLTSYLDIECTYVTTSQNAS